MKTISLSCLVAFYYRAIVPADSWFTFKRIIDTCSFHGPCLQNPKLVMNSLGIISRRNELRYHITFNDFIRVTTLTHVVILVCRFPSFTVTNLSSSSSNFISNKYMKTSIYNTIALMITAMFTCTLLVATRKSRGLSS